MTKPNAQRPVVILDTPRFTDAELGAIQRAHTFFTNRPEAWQQDNYIDEGTTDPTTSTRFCAGGRIQFEAGSAPEDYGHTRLANKLDGYVQAKRGVCTLETYNDMHTLPDILSLLDEILTRAPRAKEPRQ